MLADRKRVLLGVSGGIAAYKACELVRRLKELGCDVRVVMTENAQRFVSATTFQALSGEPVRTTLWDEHGEAAMGHIELARWAEQIIVAPATANVIAKMAAGIADDLLGTLLLASSAPVAIAPAMNQQMFAHASVQANLATLLARGALVLGPGVGAQACGDVGAGRMWEPELIIQALQAQHRVRPVWTDLSVVVTAGPTYEDLDPVRFIGNRSSGKMGFALAQAAAEMGANVTLIAGPCQQVTPQGVTRVNVRSALQMLTAARAASHACLQRFALHETKSPTAILFIACAAVADFRAAHVSLQKIKKQGTGLTLELVENPDIVSEIATLKHTNPQLRVLGFAAETENVIANAQAKRVRKNMDWIAANLVSAELGMDASDNALTLIGPTGLVEFGKADKLTLARQLLEKIAADMEPK